MQVNTALQNLARTVTSLRSERGVSATTFAHQVSTVSESTIRRIEKAGRTGYNPKLGTLVKLSNSLRVPMPILLAQLSRGTAVKAKKVAK